MKKQEDEDVDKEMNLEKEEEEVQRVSFPERDGARSRCHGS